MIFVFLLHIIHCKITIMDIWSQQNLVERNTAALDSLLPILLWTADHRNFILCSIYSRLWIYFQ